MKLGQRYLPQHLHCSLGKVVHGDEGAAAGHREVHHRPHVIGRDEDLRLQVGLFHPLDRARGRASPAASGAIPWCRPCRYTWYSNRGGGSQDLSPNSRSSRSLITSMCRSPKNPTRKPKPSAWRFPAPTPGPESFSDSFSSASLSGSYWSPSIGNRPGEHHGLGLSVAGQRLVHAPLRQRDGVAHLHLAHVLESRDQIPHLTGG